MHLLSNRAAALLLTASFLSVTAQAKPATKLSQKAAHRAAKKGITPSKAAPQWSPDSALLDQLGPEAEVRGYSVRLPSGYYSVPVKIAPGMACYRGPTHPDGTGAVIIITVAAPDGSASTAAQLREGMAYALAGVRESRPTLSATEPQSGVVNGIMCQRVYWKGMTQILSKPPVMMHGFVYVMAGGQENVIAEVQDYEPYHEASLPTAEASVLTLRKTQ